MKSKVIWIEDVSIRVDRIDYISLMEEDKRVIEYFFSGNNVPFRFTFSNKELARKNYEEIKKAMIEVCVI